MVTPDPLLVVQDWGLIDESNGTILRNEIPLVRGSRKEFGLLNSTLEALLEMKAVAIQNRVSVPGLPKLIGMYFQAVTQGKDLRRQGWWRRFRKMRDWHGSEIEFKTRCKAVFTLVHQTSSRVHERAEMLETIPRGRRSLDRLVQIKPNSDLTRLHNPFDDPLMKSTPPDAGLVAQSSNKNCTNANTLQEETMQRIAEMSAAKTLEQFTFHGRMPGQWVPQPQTINHFHGCNVGPRGEDNKGAAMNKCPSPTEVRGNGTNDIDDTSDKDLPDKVTLDLLGHYDVSSDDSDEN